jgi:dihydropteroate synthase
MFDLDSHPAVMGILNCTPDSFYDGGRYSSPARLKKRIREMRDEGADIIDLGAESTRPGASPVPVKEEIRRLLTAYEACRSIAPGIPVSIDTWKSRTAERLLKEGADMINDISGLTFDPGMPDVLARFKPAIVVMHTSGHPSRMQRQTAYKDLIRDIISSLRRSIRTARSCGIDRILIDPGIGFGKTLEQNYTILQRLPAFACLKRPLLIGLSRKSLIGKALDLPVEARLPATVALDLQALLSGAAMIRVHDIEAGRQTVSLFHHLRGTADSEKRRTL